MLLAELVEAVSALGRAIQCALDAVTPPDPPCPDLGYSIEAQDRLAAGAIERLAARKPIGR